MHELTFLTALLAGLFGSTHCLAMCGGIATALGGASGQRLPWQALLYSSGRVVSYALAGAVAGALGASVGFVFAASSWSALLRLGTAIMVIIIGLDISLGTGSAAYWLRAPERWGGRLWRRLAPGHPLSLPSAPKRGRSCWDCCGGGCPADSCIQCCSPRHSRAERWEAHSPCSASDSAPCQR